MATSAEAVCFKNSDRSLIKVLEKFQLEKPDWWL